MNIKTDNSFIVKFLKSCIFFIFLYTAFLGMPAYATAEPQLNNIKKLISDKLYNTASKQLQLYIKEKPEADYAKLLLGQTLFQTEQYNEALDIFKDFYFHSKEGKYTEAAAFYLGEIHYYQGNYPRAIKYYQEIIQNYKKSKYIFPSFYGLGNAYKAIKKYQDAESYFNTVISAKQASLELKTKSCLALAKLLYEKKKFKKALTVLTPCIKNKTPNIELYFMLAETYMALKDYKAAISYYSKAQPFAISSKYTEDILYSKGLAQFLISDFKGSSHTFLKLIRHTNKPKYLMQGYLLGGESLFKTAQYKKSLKLYRKYYKSASYNDKNIPKVLYFIGENFTNLRMYLSAIKYYKKVADNYPENRFYSLSLYGIGWANYCSENFLEGMDYLRLAEKTFTATDQKAQAKLLIAESFNEKKEYQKAASEFKDMLDKYQDISWIDKINYRYGFSYYQAKQYKEAINIWKKMQITHKGSHFAALAAYKTAWAFYKQGQLKNAASAFSSFIASYPTSYLVPFAYLKKANIFYMLNQYQNAISNYLKILKQYPDSIPADRAGYEIGWCYFLLKGENFAEKYFDKYLTKNPSSTFKKDIFFWIAQNHYNKKDYLFAANLFLKINKLYPRNAIAPRASFWHAKSLALAGETKQAIDIFQKFIEKYYKHPLRLQSTVEIADIFFAQQQYEKARMFYQAIIKNYPDSYLSTKCHIKTGDCFLAENNPKQAFEAYNKIIEGNHNVSPAQKAECLFNIANYHIENKHTDKAISNLIKILYNYETSTPFYGKAGMMLASLLEIQEKDKEGALKIYLKLATLKNETGYQAKKNIKRLTGNYFI